MIHTFPGLHMLIGCLIARGAVTLISRCGNDWTAQFPEIAAAARTLKVSMRSSMVNRAI